MSRNWLSTQEESDLLDELAQQNQRLSARRFSVTPAQGALAGQYAQAYPWMTAGAVQSLTQAGLAPDSPAAISVADMAARDAAQQGEFDTPAENVPDAWYETLWNATSSWAKPIVRTGFTILATPFEELSRLQVAAGVALTGDTEPGLFWRSLKGQAEGKDIDVGGLVSDFWTNYTEKAARSGGLMALEDLIQGKDVDLGTGFLPSGAIYEERERAKHQLSLDGQFMTPGRLFARQVTEPGTGAYQFVSGSVDFAENVFLDPVNIGLSKLSKARKAERSFQQVGLLPGVRRSVSVPEAVDHFVTTPRGQNWVRLHTENRDPVAAFRALGSQDMGGLGWEAAQRLAATTDSTQTVNVARDILGTVIRERPTTRFTNRQLGRFGRNEHGLALGGGARVTQGDSSRLGFLHRTGRLGESLPTGSVSARNIDNAIIQADRYMVNAGLPDDTRLKVLNEFTNVTGQATFEDAMEGVARAVRESLISEWNIPESRARSLTSLFSDTMDGHRVFDLDDLGNHVDVLAPLTPRIAGEAVDLSPMPGMIAELANDITFPNVREIRRLTPTVKTMQSLYDSGLWKGTVDGIRAIQSSAWIPVNILRNALTIRVLGDGQMRMAGAGLDSVVTHPMDTIAWMVAHDPKSPHWQRLQKLITSDKSPVTIKPRGTETLAGQAWDDFVSLQNSLERGSGGWLGKPGQILTGNYVKTRFGQPGFYDGWADKLSHMANDPVHRRVAGGLLEGDLRSIGQAEVGDTFADVSEWFWRGTGREFRKELGTIEGRSALLTSRQAADDYLRKNYFEPMERVTGGDPNLVNLVAKGQLDDINLRSSGHVNKLSRTLEGTYSHAAPDWMGTPQKVSSGRGNAATEAFNHVSEVAFEKILTDPENYLTKSITFRQLYFQRAEELISSMTREVQEQVVRRARKVGMDDAYLERLATQILKGEGTTISNTRLEMGDDLTRLGGLTREEFLETGEVLYRGSTRVEEGVRGGRAYFTDDPQVASRFAEAGFPEQSLGRYLGADDADLDELRPGEIRGLFRGKSGVQVATDVDDAGNLIYQTVSSPEELIDVIRQSGIQYGDEISIRQIRPDRAPNITRTKVYGRTLDLTPTGLDDTLSANPGLREALEQDRLLRTKPRGGVELESWRAHERQFDNTAEWMRQHGYGKARVPDDPITSGPVSTIALDEFIDQPARRFDVEQLVGRMEREVNDLSAGMQKVDMLAGSWAMSETKSLLYHLADRNQLMDMLKVVFPFGDVWLNVIGSWSKIVRQNPQVIRRFQQGMNGVRQPSTLGEAETTPGTGEGFFHTDPSTGEEMFTYPFLGALTSKMLSLPEGSVEFTGNAAGLNLFTATVLPGFGPAITIPASRLIPETPKWDAVRNTLMPFGEPESITDEFTPPWFNKIREAFSEPDPDKHRMFSNTVADIMRALAPERDITTVEGQQALLEEATDKARALYVIRGIAQFNLPTGPSFQWNARDVQGNLVPIKLLSEDLRNLTDAYDGDRQAAFTEWVQKYGVDNVLAVIGKSTYIVQRPFSPEGDEWLRAHPDLERDYPTTIGLFAPEGEAGAFDYPAYLRAFETGALEAVSPAEQLALANNFLGRVQYENAKKLAELNPSPEMSVWLANVRDQIAKDYPGFDGWVAESVTGKRPTTEQLIDELRQAAQDPTLAATDAGQGLQIYLSAMVIADQMVAQLPGNVRRYQQAKAARPIRDWLRSVARQIIVDHPDFARVNTILERELADDD